ncbi:hypothetical protein D3C86_2069600 [compost metagenome]
MTVGDAGLARVGGALQQGIGGSDVDLAVDGQHQPALLGEFGDIGLGPTLVRSKFGLAHSLHGDTC